MIEKRFDDGTKRFQRIENILWGLYGILATIAAYAEFVK